MIVPRRLAESLSLAVASAFVAVAVSAPGCGGDDPGHHAATIELPKRENTRVNPKELAKSKMPSVPGKR